MLRGVAMKKFNSLIAIVYSVTAILLILFLTAAVLLMIWKYNHTFTVDKWNNEPSERYKIVSDMLFKNKIIGMTENEIINFLGEETETHPQSFKSPISVYSDENTLIYELGSKYIDYELLIIKFDNGIVIDYDFGLT